MSGMAEWRRSRWTYHMAIAAQMSALARFIRDNSPYTSAANHPNPRHYTDAASYHYTIARRIMGLG